MEVLATEMEYPLLPLRDDIDERDYASKSILDDHIDFQLSAASRTSKHRNNNQDTHGNMQERMATIIILLTTMTTTMMMVMMMTVHNYHKASDSADVIEGTKHDIIVMNEPVERQRRRKRKWKSKR
jgi:hypothetical protein